MPGSADWSVPLPFTNNNDVPYMTVEVAMSTTITLLYRVPKQTSVTVLSLKTLLTIMHLPDMTETMLNLDVKSHINHSKNRKLLVLSCQEQLAFNTSYHPKPAW